MKRGKFSLSHYKLLTCDMGELVPIGLTEVLPGDSIQQSTSALIRCSPMLAPVMHPVHVRIHHWFVPHRLVWDDFESFITGGEDGEDDSVFPTTAFGANLPAVGSLPDYFGMPTLVPGGYTTSALPFRGYQLIYNEWYRDQDLQTPIVISKASGLDTTTGRSLRNVAWEKDYFTSARPWETKGPDITVPIGDSAPVTGTITTTFNKDMRLSGVAPPNPVVSNDTGSDAITAASAHSLEADLSAATPVSINTLREAFALQRYQEARARYGSRYVEYLRYLGVRSSDARLQRPEYLGGGRQTIQFSEVLQTAEGDSPVGEMRGHGIGALRSNRYRRYFEEHGYIYSLLSVKPKTIYSQGVPRTFNRRTKEDFWQQELQHIGQQQVLNKEVYQAHTNPEDVFGYQDRYDEYRRTESSIAGEFRTTALDYWHLARIFSADPALNSTFVTSTPTKRIFASQSTDVLYVMANHSIQARRPVAFKGNSFIY